MGRVRGPETNWTEKKSREDGTDLYYRRGFEPASQKRNGQSEKNSASQKEALNQDDLIVATPPLAAPSCAVAGTYRPGARRKSR